MTDVELRPGLEGVPATATSVSVLDTEAEQIVVRGYDLIELAQRLAYPDVAHLLIHGHLPDRSEQEAFCRRLAQAALLPPGMENLLAALPSGIEAMDGLRTGISALAGWEDPSLLADRSPEADRAKAERLLARAPAVAAGAWRATTGRDPVRADPELGFAERFLHLVVGSVPDADAVRAFDRILTCYSEHELPNSTFAARVVASTWSDLYGAATAAVASLKGPLHGGANEASAHLLLELQAKGGVARAGAEIKERLSRGERIMGFGHRVYMRRPDPRAELLDEELPALAARRPDGEELLQIAEAVRTVMLEEKGLYPNTDFPIGIALYLLGIPIELDTPIFYCARVAGLMAHAIEEHAHGRLYRPRVSYQGPRGLHVPEGMAPSPC
jgi:citrate synthase